MHAPVFLAACLLLSAACAATPPAAQPEAQPEAVEEPRPPAYAAYSRQREQELRAMLRAILAVTLPEVQGVLEELGRNVTTIDVPERFATREAVVRSWGTDEQRAYEDVVTGMYLDARSTLQAIYDTALAQGRARARTMAAQRSPMDPGSTGDTLLDQQLASFDETLRAEIDMEDIFARQQQDAHRSIELFEVFNSFTSEGADAVLGGRLMLFVGGEERQPPPHAYAVLRTDVPAERGFTQALRHRVLRGNTIVQDLGWRPMPNVAGLPPSELRDETYLVASALAPVLRTDVPAFERLKDMRVLVDLQTAVFDGQQSLLGGVNWQIEYRISSRGEVSWQPSGERPAFDPVCEQVRALMPGAALKP